MKCTNKLKVLAALLAVSGFAFAGTAWAQHGDHEHGKAGDGHMDAHSEAKGGHSHEMAEMHGGSVTMTKEFHFETVFTEKGMRVYAYNMKQMPIKSKGLRGSVTIRVKGEGGKENTSKVPLRWTSAAKDSLEMFRNKAHMAHADSLGYLFAPFDFSSVGEGNAKVDITITNLTGKKEKEVNFRETFKMTPLFGKACPMHPDQASMAGGTCSKCGMTYQAAEVLYECPMHSEVQSTSPGKCPKCGMDLTLKAETHSEKGSSKEGGMHGMKGHKH